MAVQDAAPDQTATGATGAAVGPARAARAAGRGGVGATWHALVGDPIVLLAAVVLLSMLAVAAIGPSFVGDPAAQELNQRLRPPTLSTDGEPAHPMGTDHLGRDILSRVVQGARVSLSVALASIGLAALAGLAVGLLTGYYGGIIDDVIMRIVDVQLSIPYIMLAMSIVTVVGTSLQIVVVVLLLYGWVIYARLVRAQTLSLRAREFVVASRALGATDGRILLRHITPNLISPLVVISTLELASMIVLEAGLSFLGLGIPPPTATWGVVLADGREYLTAGVWWIAAFPCAAITATTLSINLLGDWLRDRLDPRGQTTGLGRAG
jgi:peptide/nickel transport system permease protein